MLPARKRRMAIYLFVDAVEACIAPGYLDNRLAYAARLKVSLCQSARMCAGLR
jgi:hypothetical protein